MSNILINGLNAKSGGGKTILDNFLIILSKIQSKHIYYVLVPNINNYKKYETKHVKIISVYSILKKDVFAFYVYSISLPKLIRSLRINLVFNLADIPIPSNIKQIFFFDWAYAVYPNSNVWKRMGIKSFFKRKIKLYLFNKYVSYPSLYIAQTDIIKNRLLEQYKIKKVIVIPSPLTFEAFSKNVHFDFKLPKGINLLCLTYYYSHKNLEIFIPLAKIIKSKGLDYKLIITINKTQDNKAKLLLNEIKKNNLEDTIINIGPINHKYVNSLYSQCDAFIMPTLLESYGLTYIEAMQNNKTIITSDLDFAKFVCGDVGYYFDPNDPISIFNTIQKALNDEKRNEKIKMGLEKLNKIPLWNEVVDKYINLIDGEIINEQ